MVRVEELSLSVQVVLWLYCQISSWVQAPSRQSMILRYRSLWSLHH
jgi:hypothetical protein